MKEEKEEGRPEGCPDSGEGAAGGAETGTRPEEGGGGPSSGKEGSGEPAGEELPLRLAEMNDRWLRAVADLDNFRKRTARERERERVHFRGSLILPFLDVLDDLERALAEDSGESSEGLRRGLEMIHRKFLVLLGDQGVEPIRSVDEPFDPEKHEALQAVPDPDREEGIVAAEIRKGYLLEDRVLRPAQVVVSAPVKRAGAKDVPEND